MPGCGSQRLLRCRLHPAGRGSNSSSLFPPLAAVVAVAPKGEPFIWKKRQTRICLFFHALIALLSPSFFRMMSHEGIWLRRVSHAVIRTLVRVRRPSKASSRYCISATACIAWSETQRRPSGVLQSVNTMASIFRRPGVPAR